MSTVAERLTARGLKDIVLPVSGECVKIRTPKTKDLMRIGLFPLVVSRMDLDNVDPDEKEALFKEAERSAIRLICECAVEPKIVNRKARPDELRIDALLPDDFAYLSEQTLEFAVASTKQVPTTDHPRAKENFKALAVACETFGIDPTLAEEWDQERSKRLLFFAGLVVKENGNPAHR